MNPPEKIAPGETYGRLLVVGRLPTEKRQRFYLCRCTCVEEVRVAGRHLRSGNTKSCGCLRREAAAQNVKQVDIGQKYGLKPSTIYRIINPRKR